MATDTEVVQVTKYRNFRVTFKNVAAECENILRQASSDERVQLLKYDCAHPFAGYKRLYNWGGVGVGANKDLHINCIIRTWTPKSVNFIEKIVQITRFDGAKVEPLLAKNGEKHEDPNVSVMFHYECGTRQAFEDEGLEAESKQQEVVA